MIKISKNVLFLILIVLLASILRLYLLGQVPGSLNWDEVSLGYNAKSILLTGRDEYGEFLPLVLRSFDDYKPALYTYLIIPFVAVLGLSEISVRLPSAFFGILTVVVVYFLVKELLGKNDVELAGRKVGVDKIALVASLFMAISPWHIQFSRIAFESNVGLAINLLSLYLFFRGLKRPVFLIPAFIIASSNIHMYQSDRVFTPLLFIFLSLIYIKVLLKVKKYFIIAFFGALLVALPFIVYLFTNQNALMRAKGVSVFSDSKIVERSAEKLVYDREDGNQLGLILDNRRIEFIKNTVFGYISHFDLNWLFITGDIARHHAPEMGLLYLFELPFILIGFYNLVFLRIERKYKLAFFTYFFLVAIPASITSGVPHAVRTLNFLWTYQLFSAIGIIVTYNFFRSKINNNKNIIFIAPVVLFYATLISINFLYYLNQYFVQLNYYTARDWLYGYKQAISYVNPIAKNYDRVVVENEVPFDQSYMFFLFYLDIDPKYYQQIGGTTSGGFKEKHRGFYNYTFESVSKNNDDGKILLIGKLSDMNDHEIKKIIYYPDGQPAVAIAEK